jgi:hypothetical protein
MKPDVEHLISPNESEACLQALDGYRQTEQAFAVHQGIKHNFRVECMILINNGPSSHALIYQPLQA